MLTRYGYFSLIGGYKNIYINKSVRKYKRGKDDFIMFKRQLDKFIIKLISITSLTEQDILSAMGFPANWKKITTFRKLV